MKSKITVFVFVGILYFLYPIRLPAQNIRFKHLTTSDGLSHPHVRCIVQDHLGFMWFGTFDGLNKYDGYKFTVYRHLDSDPNSIPSNAIIFLSKDSRQNLWIGTSAGLCAYDYERDVFITYHEVGGFNLDTVVLSSILKDSKDNLWIGTSGQGLLQVDTLNKVVIQYVNDQNNHNSLSSNSVQQLFEDSKHNIWAATLHDGINVLQNDTKTFTHYSHRQNDPNSIIGNSITSIAEDEQGYLWFACTGNGLSRTKVDQGEPHTFINDQPDPLNRSSLPDRSISVLQADQNGGLWIGSQYAGLFYLPKNEQIFHHYMHNINNPYSLNNDNIFSMYQDNTKDIWIGTYTGGINVIHYTKQAFRHYFNSPGGTNQLNNNYVWQFAEDRNGMLWIATDGGGLNLFDPHSENFKHFDSNNSNLNSDRALSVCIDSQNELWIGTWAGGFSLFDERTTSFKTFTHENSGLSNNNVMDIADGRDGTLWLATQGGLNRYNKQTKQFTIYSRENSHLSHNHLEVVKVDSNGNILIGGQYGINILDPKNNTMSTYRHNSGDNNSLSNGIVTSFFEESRKILWISTTNGLNRLNRETQEMTHYFTTDGLPNNLVYGLEKDSKGFLWMSVNGGISRFDPRSKTFKNFTKEDGLQENIFIKKSHFKASNGKLYFGGVNGFNVFNPDDIIKNQAIPPVILTDFQVFNKSVKPAFENSPLKKNINNADEIVLSYQQNVFSFEFSALSYAASIKSQYAYMLEGFEKNWNYIDKRRNVTYTNINPGHYVFRVKGSNDDGVWNEQGASIKITIIPPFWETVWFRLVGIFFMLGAIVTTYKIRTARIRSRNRELERHIQERTAQLESANKELEAFSYSVSHDLRAPLRTIDGFSNALLEDYSKNLDETGKDHLNRVRAASQHMDQLINDILNLSRVMQSEMIRTSVDMSDLAQSIANDLLRTQPERKVTFTITPGITVYADRNLMRIVLNNLFDNAWKFTSNHPAAKIEFGTTMSKGWLVYYVRDDGDGFDLAYAGKLFTAFQRMHTAAEFEGTGIGLTTVRRIIRRHGGEVWAEAEKGKGATFYFTLL